MAGIRLVRQDAPPSTLVKDTSVTTVLDSPERIPMGCLALLCGLFALWAACLQADELAERLIVGVCGLIFGGVGFRVMKGRQTVTLDWGKHQVRRRMYERDKGYITQTLSLSALVELRLEINRSPYDSHRRNHHWRLSLRLKSGDSLPILQTARKEYAIQVTRTLLEKLQLPLNDLSGSLIGRETSPPPYNLPEAELPENAFKGVLSEADDGTGVNVSPDEPPPGKIRLLEVGNESIVIIRQGGFGYRSLLASAFLGWLLSLALNAGLSLVWDFQAGRFSGGKGNDEPMDYILFGAFGLFLLSVVGGMGIGILYSLSGAERLRLSPQGLLAERTVLGIPIYREWVESRAITNINVEAAKGFSHTLKIYMNRTGRDVEKIVPIATGLSSEELAWLSRLIKAVCHPHL